MPKGTSAVTTAWTPPDAITGMSATVFEDLSQVLIEWNASALSDVDFNKYTVLRRNTVGSLAWELIATITNKAKTTWKDIYTGQGQSVEYKVLQWKNIVGESPLGSEDSEQVAAMLESDVWFVIGQADPEDEEHAFELPVIGETHTRPIQQEVFEPIIGVRKKVARGNVLGFEGALDMRWVDVDRETAKLQLTYLAENAGPHILKSPFGDVWEVEFDAADYSYTMGGHMGIKLGWVEVR